MMKHKKLLFSILAIFFINTNCAQVAENKFTPQLFKAAAEGDAKRVEVLINLGANINAIEPIAGLTPLMVAATLNKPEVVKILIANNANREITNKGGLNVLAIPLMKGSIDVANILFKNTTDNEIQIVNDKLELIIDTFLKSITKEEINKPALDLLLRLATQLGQIKVVKALIDAGANIEGKNQYGTTPLMFAAVGHNVAKDGHQAEVAKILIEAKADIEACNKDQYTALAIASYVNKIDVIKILLSRKANIETKNINQDTPLILAAYQGHSQAVEILLDAKADIEATNKNRKNAALALASYFNKIDVIKILLDRKANIETEDIDQNTPLMLATNQNHFQAAELLLKAKANVNAELQNKRLIKLVIDNNKTEIIPLLLKYGAELNHEHLNPIRKLLALDTKDNSLISFTIQNNKALLKSFFDKDRPSSLFDKTVQDMTALMWAAARGNGDVVEDILKYAEAKRAGNKGPFINNKFVVQALSLAQERGHREIAKEIYKYLHTARTAYGKLWRNSIQVILKQKKEIPDFLIKYLTDFVYGEFIFGNSATEEDKNDKT